MTVPYASGAPAVVSAPVSPLTYPAQGDTNWKGLNDAAHTAAAAQADAALYRALQTEWARRPSMVDAYRLAASDRPIITLRFDDNSTDNNTLADAGAALGLPMSFATIRKSIDASTQQTLAQLVKSQLQGHEIMCHSYNHDTGPNTTPGANYPAGTSIEAQMVKEFITAAEDMYGMNLWTQQWIQPGTWVTGSGQNSSAYPPFLGGVGQPGFYDGTDLGRLIKSRFLGVSSYANDGFGTQTGYRTRPNLRRFPKSTNYYDNKSIAQMQAIVNAAIAGDHHLQMFCHSGMFKLGQGGPTLTDYINTFLPWLRAQVDAGRCYVMTESAGSMAARGVPVNLLGDNAFASAQATGVDAASITTHISDKGDSYKTVGGPTGASVTALSVNAGSNFNADLEYTADVPLRSLRLVTYAKGDGADSTVTATVQAGGGSVSQGLSPTQVTAKAAPAGSWTRIEFIFGTAPSNAWIKPIVSVPSGSAGPVLFTNPVLTVT